MLLLGVGGASGRSARMDNPKPIRSIAGTVTTVDLGTGKEVKTEGMQWGILPPSKDRCQICAIKHEPDQPHDATRMYYQVIFNSNVGRLPTWADAMAHCSSEIQEKWKDEFVRRDIWSEPPKGERPVKHHGVE